MEAFYTWETLATFAGAAALTGLLTQWLKEAVPKLPTQWMSYLIALVILTMATVATRGGIAWSEWALIPINAVLVSLSANGAFTAAKRALGERNQRDK